MTSDPNLSTVRKAILLVLNENGEIAGTETLTLAINTRKYWTIINARRLEADGEITIIPSTGGRGRKTIYKRNRNSPGQRRKR